MEFNFFKFYYTAIIYLLSFNIMIELCKAEENSIKYLSKEYLNIILQTIKKKLLKAIIYQKFLKFYG